MSGSTLEPQDEPTRPISVAELLAKNGTIGAPPPAGRRRRRRGNSDAVTVAELTGEIPVIRDDQESHPRASAPADRTVDEDRPVTAPRPVEHHLGSIGWSEAQPRWPKSPPQSVRESPRAGGPQRSPDPRPERRADPARNGRPAARPAAESDAEQMRPDPVDNFADIEVDVMDTEVRDPDLPGDDSAYVRSYLRGTDSAAGDDEDLEDFGGFPDFPDFPDFQGFQGFQDDDVVELPSEVFDEDHADIEDDLAEEAPEEPGRWSPLLGGAAIVGQSVLAVAFGAGLFIGFDQLWRWNSIVALVLTVLVTLGLVAAVQAVRKTVDIASTLIAVAVGLLVTLGPLALHID